MSAPVWSTPAGFLGTLTERESTSTVIQAVGAITYTIISGSLPAGLTLSSSTGIISGIPASVYNNKDSLFSVRAKNVDGLVDRSFVFTVAGPQSPVWVTPPGLLNVGLNGELYGINKEFVDFTLQAETDVLAPGNSIKYYISDNDGTLPPGLTLNTNGRITGYVDDVLVLDVQSSITGGFDTDFYDGDPYDQNISGNVPLTNTAISKIYQFVVTATDGIDSTRQACSIKVVDPATLRTDYSYTTLDTVVIDASAGYLLAPIWKNKYGDRLPPASNLGTVRAARKHIFTLHNYDPYDYQGTAAYNWDSINVNPDIKFITDSDYDITGIPRANTVGRSSILFRDAAIIPVAGMQIRFSDFLEGFDSTTYTVTGVIKTSDTSGYMYINQPLAVTIPDSTIAYVGTASRHPPGLSLDPSTGEIYGQLSYQPSYSTSYRFTVQIRKTSNTDTIPVINRYNGAVTFQPEYVVANQIFILTIKGDVDSVIQFISPAKLGNVISGEISNLAIVAQNVNAASGVVYDLIQGVLPTGLRLNSDGTIQGKIEYGNAAGDYYFTVRASDVYRISYVDKEFHITVTSSNIEYTRLYVRPFFSVSKRSDYRAFISDSIIFDPLLIYRPNDPEFGVQPNIKMMIETGIQKTTLDLYASALTQHFARKKFYFGEIKSILAQDSMGNNIYELIYADIIDDQMIGSQSPANSESVGNIQLQLESITLPGGTIATDEFLRPKYMTTLQPTSGVPVGFIKAVPICYTLPGAAIKILSRIQASGVDLKQFNFDTDRIVVESTQDTGQSGWILYPN
jgi:hypothetical protein